MELYNYNHHAINNQFKDFYRYKYKIYPGKKIFTKICSGSVKQSAINLQHTEEKVMETQECGIHKHRITFKSQARIGFQDK